MEGHCLTGQSPQWAVVPMEGEVELSKKSPAQNESEIRISCPVRYISMRDKLEVMLERLCMITRKDT